MPHLSFAELIELRVPLTAAEAVALTLAAAYVLRQHNELTILRFGSRATNSYCSAIPGT